MENLELYFLLFGVGVEFFEEWGDGISGVGVGEQMRSMVCPALE